MGIEDIQISEELETNAPSIKYRGNEGPKSPQEIEQMIAGMMNDIADDFERDFGYDMSLANPEVVTEYIKEWLLEICRVVNHYHKIQQNQLALFNQNLQDQYYLTDRWQRMVVSWV